MPQNDDNTGTIDAKDEGILDLLISKQWAIKLATEAARTVLSVDQIIVARQAGGPKPPGPNPVRSLPHSYQKLGLTKCHRTGTRTKWIKLKSSKSAMDVICVTITWCRGWLDILSDNRVKA